MGQSIKNMKQLNDFLGEAGSNYVLIDFFANWCGPCKEIGPKVDELAKQLGNLTIIKVNVDESEEIVEAYDVSVLPTFIILKSKRKLETFTGSNFEKFKEMVMKVTGRISTPRIRQAFPNVTPAVPVAMEKQIPVSRMAHGSVSVPPGQLGTGSALAFMNTAPQQQATPAQFTVSPNAQQIRPNTRQRPISLDQTATMRTQYPGPQVQNEKKKF